MRSLPWDAPRQASDGALGAWLSGGVVMFAGVAVATAVLLDQWLYFALGVTGMAATAVILQRPMWGVLGWLFAFPLLDPYVRIDLPAGIPDITVNRVVTGMVLLTLCLQVMLRRRRWLPMTAAEVAMIALTGVMLIDIFVRSKSLGEDGLLVFDEFLSPFLLYTSFKNLVATGTRLRAPLVALALGALYLAPHGAFQFITHGELPFWKPPDASVHSLVEEQGRARGPFTDSVSYGALSSMVLLAALYCHAWARGLGRRIGFLLLVGAAGVAILVCMTRAVWLGLVVSLLLSARCEARLRRLIVAIFLGGALLVAGTYLFLSENAESVSERASDYETVYIRIGLYNAALRMIAEQPLVGFGRHAHDVFFIERRHFVSDIFGIDAEWGTLAGPPHNALLTMAMQYGVFAALLYAAIFFYLIRDFRAVRRLRTDGALPPHAFGSFMLAMSVVYITIGLTTDVMSFDFFGKLYFMLAGGAAGLLQRAHGDPILGAHRSAMVADGEVRAERGHTQGFTN